MRTISTTVTNIRNITEATFTPAPEGVTWVTGPNGIGKTTLTVLAPLIAGWGETKHAAGTLSQLITVGETKATAQWVFEHADHTYQVDRQLRRSGQTASSKATIRQDGELLDVRDGKVATWLTDLLGMGPAEFLVTSHIAQGDVAALVSSNPAVVRDTLRTTLNLDYLITLAGKAERIYKGATDLPKKVTMEEVTAAEKHVTETAHLLETVADSAALLEEEMLTARQEWEHLDEEARHAEQQATALASNRDAFASYQNHLTEAERSAHEAEDTYTALVQECGWSGTNLVDDVEQTQDIRGLCAALRDLDAGIPTVEDMEATKDAILTAQNMLHDAEKAVADAEERLEGVDSVDALHARAHDFMEAADLIDGQAECPTCGTTLNDGVGLVEELRQKAHDLSAQADEVVAVNTVARDAVKARSNAEREMLAAFEEFNGQVFRRNVFKDVLSQLGTVLSTREEKATLHPLLQRLVAAAEQARTARAHEAAARVALQDIHVASDEDIAAAQDTARTARTAADQARVEAQNINERAATIRAQCDTAHRQHSANVYVHDTLMEQRKTYETAVHKNRVGRLVVAALRDMARTQTKVMATKIETQVNDLLDRVGMGFTDFQLGENFTPTINRDGVTLSTQELSGGEQATMGLLIRLAVSAAQSGALDTTITADEPLANLDDDAARQVCDVLAGVGTPVTIIAHSHAPSGKATRHVHFHDRDGHVAIEVEDTVDA